jgi:hypothetical protein
MRQCGSAASGPSSGLASAGGRTGGLAKSGGPGERAWQCWGRCWGHGLDFLYPPNPRGNTGQMGWFRMRRFEPRIRRRPDWGDPVAGIAVIASVRHVGWEVTADVTHRLADRVAPPSSRRLRKPPGPSPKSGTPMPGRDGPAARSGSRSKAGSTRTSPSATPTPSAARSRTRSAASSLRPEARPGQPAQHPTDPPA